MCRLPSSETLNAPTECDAAVLGVNAQHPAYLMVRRVSDSAQQTTLIARLPNVLRRRVQQRSVMWDSRARGLHWKNRGAWRSAVCSARSGLSRRYANMRGVLQVRLTI